MPFLFLFHSHNIKRTHNLNLIRTLLTTTSVRSGLVPTFNTSNDKNKMVTKLGLSRISSVVLTGKPNTSLPSEFNVNLNQFLPEAISAVGVVTGFMASGDWDKLDGLVERDCIESLQTTMAKFNSVEKELVFLNPDDVFLAFISNPHECSLGNNLHLVTFSQSKLGLVKNMIEENKDLSKIGILELLKENKTIMREVRTKSTMLNVKEDLRDLLKHRLHLVSVLKRNDLKRHEQELQKHKAMAKEYNKKVKTLRDFMDNISADKPLAVLATNEIVVCNYRFQRNSNESPWIITEVGHIKSHQAWAPIFKARWKARLVLNTMISIKYGSNYDFCNVLRADYVSLLMALLLFIILPMI